MFLMVIEVGWSHRYCLAKDVLRIDQMEKIDADVVAILFIFKFFYRLLCAFENLKDTVQVCILKYFLNRGGHI